MLLGASPVTQSVSVLLTCQCSSNYCGAQASFLLNVAADPAQHAVSCWPGEGITWAYTVSRLSACSTGLARLCACAAAQPGCHRRALPVGL